MNKITVEEFLELDPGYGEAKIREIAGDKAEWTVMDILRLNDVPAKDRLWAVLNAHLIDDAILHEFACRCAERALSRIEKPDPRSVAAIAAKRAWLKGEITDEELNDVRAAAWEAAREAERWVEWAAAREAERWVEWAAAREAARWVEEGAAWTASWTASWAAASDAEREWQMAELIKMLEE